MSINDLLTLFTKDNGMYAGYASILVILYGLWKLANRGMGQIIKLFESTKHEIGDTKTLFANLTHEIEKLNLNLEKANELNEHRFNSIENRLEKMEERIERLQERLIK